MARANISIQKKKNSATTKSMLQYLPCLWDDKNTVSPRAVKSRESHMLYWHRVLSIISRTFDGGERIDQSEKTEAAKIIIWRLSLSPDSHG